MFAKVHLILLSLGWLGILAACVPVSTLEVGTALPSYEVAPTSTAAATGATQTIPAPIGFDCQDIQEISPKECQALVRLYESTNGAAWNDNSGWLANDFPCNWYGVICERGHVVELQLFYNGLTGSLPPEIGDLNQLTSLYLDDNRLSGSLPAEIENLTELQLARLGGNQFDRIPLEFFGIRNLAFLDLHGNQLSGEIPSEIGNLSSLQELNLSSNHFTGSLPPELGNLVFLHILDLSHNQLSGPILPVLGDLKSLNQLDLSFNQLSGSIPLELADLAQLYWLDLSYNQLTGAVPESIQNASFSERRLWGNLFEGTIPASEQAVTAVEYQGIRFEFDSSLAESVWPETMPAQEPTADNPGWIVWPEHLRFTFPYQRTSDISEAVFGPPRILIYSAEAYSMMSDSARAEIEELQALLEARPTEIETEIPALPLINAAQVFHAQVKYLDFQNGEGVHFITHYSQDVSPITDQNVFYTFQGLTSDGAYYVAAYFPITAAGLTDAQAPEDWEAFNARYQEYLTETVSHLDALSPTDFGPDLEILDQVIRSLEVDTP